MTFTRFSSTPLQTQSYICFTCSGIQAFGRTLILHIFEFSDVRGNKRINYFDGKLIFLNKIRTFICTTVYCILRSCIKQYILILLHNVFFKVLNRPIRNPIDFSRLISYSTTTDVLRKLPTSRAFFWKLQRSSTTLANGKRMKRREFKKKRLIDAIKLQFTRNTRVCCSVLYL